MRWSQGVTKTFGNGVVLPTGGVTPIPYKYWYIYLGTGGLSMSGGAMRTVLCACMLPTLADRLCLEGDETDRILPLLCSPTKKKRKEVYMIYI